VLYAKVKQNMQEKWFNAPEEIHRGNATKEIQNYHSWMFHCVTAKEIVQTLVDAAANLQE
jgi:hypothetical protein